MPPIALWLMTLACLVFQHEVQAELLESHFPLEAGMMRFSFVSDANLNARRIDAKDAGTAIEKLCEELSPKFHKLGWTRKPCGTVKWRADFKTEKGRPLIYATFGEGKNRTLFLGGVHPDELTPVEITFRLARHLDSMTLPQGVQVIVAPLANPDGFLLKFPLRTNGAVDINRNFPTKDWHRLAFKYWREERGERSRYFPGFFPLSEIETLFQVNLLGRFTPDKVLSLHAPLGFMDYDGPPHTKVHKQRTLSPAEAKAKSFVRAVAKKSRNYRIEDYEFLPGSLGNYAGFERDLPTITVELQTTDNRLTKKYWKQFLPGFMHSIEYRVTSSNKTAQLLQIFPGHSHHD